MKRRFTRLVSLMLVFALLLSAFSVLVFANEGAAEASGNAAALADDEIELIINRPFDEGWGYSNGF